MKRTTDAVGIVPPSFFLMASPSALARVSYSLSLAAASFSRPSASAWTFRFCFQTPPVVSVKTVGAIALSLS